MSIVKEMLAEKGPSETFREAKRVAREYAHKMRDEGRIAFLEGSHPSIHIARRTLPEAWEDMTMALMGVGAEIHTHYDPGFDKGEYASFPSIEASATMHIEEPFAEPRFHKHYLAGGMGIGDYIAEIEGVKDHWMIQPVDVAQAMKEGRFEEIKGDERWNYTYSQRFRAYPFFDINGDLKTVNQLQSVIDNLTRNPTSRSAQCITWDPRWDHNDEQFGEGIKWSSYHAPCLQRFWFRLRQEPGKKGYRLHINGHWRSRDHLKAVPTNIIGVTEGMHEHVRKGLEKSLGVEVRRGNYVDINDSLHLYGHYLDPRTQGLDAEAYLEDIFRIASGEPIEKRLMVPGTPIHDMTKENIDDEYKKRIENPDLGRPQ